MCVLILSFFGTTNVEASSSDLFLDNLNFNAHINTDGSMDVIETWNIDISDTNTLYKTFKIDKSRYSGITNVVVKDVTSTIPTKLEKSSVWKYHLDKNTYFGGINNDGLYEIAWGVGLENKKAQRQYEISYKVKDAVSKHLDYAQLYWQFVGEDFEISSSNVTGTIYLPSKVSNKNDIKVWGHTEDLNGEIYATDTDKIEFEINNFRSGRYIEARVLFPTELITSSSRGDNSQILDKVISEETKWVQEANARREFKKNIKTIIMIVINILAFIGTVLIIKSIMKNNKKLKEMVKFVPEQEIKYFREMPREDATPAQAVAIDNKMLENFPSTIIGDVFSATLLNLNLKKLIEFKMEEKNNIIIILKDNPEISNEIEEDEKLIFDFVKTAASKNDDPTKITIKQLEKYIKRSSDKVVKLKEKIEKSTSNTLYTKELANRAQYKEYKSNRDKIILYSITLYFIIFAIIFAIAFCGVGVLPCTIALIITIIINLIIIAKLNSKVNVLTQKGVNEQSQWKGLKNYMKDFSLLDKREVPDIVIWEKFLVYATAFGIANKVLKQLRIVYPNIEEMVDMNTYTYMNLMIHTNISTSFSNSISNAISSTYSSATGGGGGFSGGGGRTVVAGGGGGGR